MNRLLGFLLVAVPLWGCASDPLQLEGDPSPRAAAAQVSAAMGEVFQLRPGQVATVQGTDLLVAFRGVESDSRCPADVTCVWAGDAEVSVGVAREGGAWSWHSLHTGVDPRELVLGDHLLRLHQLRPHPRTDLEIEPRDYVVELAVTPI